MAEDADHCALIELLFREPHRRPFDDDFDSGETAGCRKQRSWVAHRHPVSERDGRCREGGRELHRSEDDQVSGRYRHFEEGLDEFAVAVDDGEAGFAGGYSGIQFGGHPRVGCFTSAAHDRGDAGGLA